ncbi:MAG: glycosyltransferase [Planctomycetes bacterium]|nr:glycosyltransferase [Planctomycetota bacterium]
MSEIEINPSQPHGKGRHRAHPRTRVALYSHDTIGIGHLRRNLLIAQTLITAGQVDSVLLIAGVREASAFCFPYGVDCLTLPALSKTIDGNYVPRSLGITLRELVCLRRDTIDAALRGYFPTVLIVDKVPRGAQRELESALLHLRRMGTKCVLGMRDVLDNPAAVCRQWLEEENDAAIEEFYDAVWIYSDPKVFDPVQHYGFSPAVVAKVRYTGYFDQRRRLDFTSEAYDNHLAELLLLPGKLVLCMVGGGQDGETLARAFANAQLPRGMNAVLVTGPFMPSAVYHQLCQQTAADPRRHVVRFLAEPTALIARADRVIAMGGYNTINEVLSFRKHALIVPRTVPRGEQSIRAKRLAELGLIDVIQQTKISPTAISSWLERDLGTLPGAIEEIDFDGLSRLPKLIADLPLVRQRTPRRTRQIEEVSNVPS